MVTQREHGTDGTNEKRWFFDGDPMVIDNSDLKKNIYMYVYVHYMYSQ